MVASRTQISGLVTSLASSQACSPNSDDWITLPSPILKIAGRLLLSSISDLPLLLPPQFPGFTASDRNAAYLLVSAPRDTGSNQVDIGVHPSRFLRLQLPGGKKGQIIFLQVLKQSMEYIQRLLDSEHYICIACDTGKDLSVGIALAAIQKFFDDSGSFVKSSQHCELRSTLHPEQPF